MSKHAVGRRPITAYMQNRHPVGVGVMHKRAMFAELFKNVMNHLNNLIVLPRSRSY